MYIFPFDDDLSSYSMSCDLDGKIFNFDFDWNASAESWTFSIKDSENVPLVLGLRVSINIDLIYLFEYITGLKGQLWCSWLNGSPEELTEKALFNGEANLVYLSESDLEALED